MVCSSSMKRMTLPSFFTSSSAFLIRSSNSPRYLVPATIPLRSRLRSFLFSSSSGASAAAMRWARPSAMAVLPTPGSPISTGLFLARRERICTTRWISLSRPMTGSSLPCRAASVRSRVNSSSVLPVFLFSLLGVPAPLVTVWGLVSLSFCCTEAYIFRGSTPTVRRMRTAILLPSRSRPISRCSVPM